MGRPADSRDELRFTRFGPHEYDEDLPDAVVFFTPRRPFEVDGVWYTSPVGPDGYYRQSVVVSPIMTLRD